MIHGAWIVRGAVVAAAAVVIAACGSEPDDATRRFDHAFWRAWLEMSEHDRRTVCWSKIGDAADDYAASFDAGYLRAEERAIELFARACEPYKERQ